MQRHSSFSVVAVINDQTFWSLIHSHTSLQIHVLQQAAADSKMKEEAMRLELRREAVLRKKAYNQIRELKGNIRVLARVRPAAVGAQGSLNTAAPVSLEVC